MKNYFNSYVLLLMSCLLLLGSCSKEDDYVAPVESTEPDFDVTEANANVNEFGQLIMSIKTKGIAGNTYPEPTGQLDGAPVLGYVFPTTLKSTDVGFGETDGIVAMALTSHPDFDDTPLWDENNDQIYTNDGRIWHAHWVVLSNDDRVKGGLSVKEFQDDENVILPPTNPGMPMYMDSPGFQVVQKDGFLKVVIPSERINNNTNFRYDAVAAFMKVNTSDKTKPMLGVYEVYSVLSGDLSLPFSTNSN